MAKKTKVEVEAGATSAEETVNRPVDGPITVTLANGTSRTYARETHGDVYKTLAANYHESNAGSKVA